MLLERPTPNEPGIEWKPTNQQEGASDLAWAPYEESFEIRADIRREEIRLLATENQQLRKTVQDLAELYQHQSEDAFNEQVQAYEGMLQDQMNSIEALQDEVTSLEAAQKPAQVQDKDAPFEELFAEREKLQERENAMMSQFKQFEMDFTRDRMEIRRQKTEVERLLEGVQKSLANLNRS